MPGNHLPASLGLTIIQIKFPLLPLPPCCISGQSLPAACPAHAGEKLFGLFQSPAFLPSEMSCSSISLKEKSNEKDFLILLFYHKYAARKSTDFLQEIFRNILESLAWNCQIHPDIRRGLPAPRRQSQQLRILLKCILIIKGPDTKSKPFSKSIIRNNSFSSNSLNN